MMHSTKSETTPKPSWRFEAFGTYWEIASDKEIEPSLRQTIETEVETFDKTYSRFRDDSLVQEMARRGGKHVFPESAKAIFEFYDQLYEQTEGSVTPLVGDTLVSAGYDATYSLTHQQKTAPVPRYETVFRRKGLTIEVTRPTTIDIGAVGKGYFVDYITELMKQAGHENFIVDGSGDMRAAGGRRETVGLENPRNTEEIIGSVELRDKALCASAVNRRAWGEWHHIIDPATSLPTHDIIATWVIADTAMVADGLATALFFTTPKTLAKTYNYEYLRMHANGSIEYSEYFAKGVF